MIISKAQIIKYFILIPIFSDGSTLFMADLLGTSDLLRDMRDDYA